MPEEKQTAGEALAEAIMNEEIGKVRIDGRPFKITWYSSELLPNLTKSDDCLDANQLNLDDIAVSLSYEEDHQLFEVEYTAAEIRDAINGNGVWKIGEDDGIEIFLEKPFNIPGGEVKPASARPKV